jgi:hypothetical protein
VQCPLCNKTEAMFFAFGPDGSHEGVGCQECRRVWYSDATAEKARKVISHALRAFIDTQEFPADAVAQGAYGHDPRFDQQDFDDYYLHQLGRNDSFVWYEGPSEDTDVDGADDDANDGSDRSSDRKDPSA